MDIVPFLLQVGVGATAGVLTAVAVRFLGHAFDFVPRKLNDVGIGSSFEPFYARGPGDNYDDVLWLRLQNHSGAPLFVSRAVYFPKKGGVPVYENALRSQKYRSGFEVKFGDQWKEIACLLMPGDSTDSYVPLTPGFDPNAFPQGRRGSVLIEYVHSGKTGIHRSKL